MNGELKLGRSDLALGVICALGAVSVITAIGFWGPLSPPGLALGLLLLAAVGLASLFLAPQVLVVLTPALIPLPYLAHVFPYEMSLILLAVLLALIGWRSRADWLFQLGRLEVALLVFMAWAFSTAFWCSEWSHYFLGVRMLAMGLLSLWTASRLAILVPRRWFELGLLIGTVALASAALGRYMTSGLSGQRAVLQRDTATDLGWGTANFIATLLLLMTPVLLHLALHADRRWNRVLAWIAIPLVAALQGLIASRAALILFIAGLIAMVAGRRSRRSLVVLAVVGILIVFVGPWNTSILTRFTSPRELGSVTIRLLYFREAWRRTTGAFPFGIGFGQGWSYPDRLNGTGPHDYWLDLSSELGPLGVLTWLMVLVVLWRGLRALDADPATGLPGRALRVSFWLSQLHTLVEGTFQGIQYQFLFFWLMGGYLGYGAAARGADAVTARPDAAAESSSR